MNSDSLLDKPNIDNIATNNLETDILLDQMNIFVAVPENCVGLELNATILNDKNELEHVSKKLSLNEIILARNDFLTYVAGGDDYNATYVLTDDGKAYLESLRKDED